MRLVLSAKINWTPVNEIPTHLFEAEKALSRAVLGEGLKSNRVKNLSNDLLIKVKIELKNRGIESEIVTRNPTDDNPNSFLRLHVPKHVDDLVIRNLQLIEKKAAPEIIYDPSKLMAARALGGWSSAQHSLYVDLSGLLDTRNLPATVIHERLHLEKSFAISQKKNGALAPFYGRFFGHLEGKSGYAKRQYLSIDEVKAWMIDLKIREKGLLARTKNGAAHAGVLGIQYDGLIDLYKTYLNLSHDALNLLNEVERSLDHYFHWNLKFTEISWFKDSVTDSARLSLKNFNGTSYHYEVPLVALEPDSGRGEALALLKKQVALSKKHVQSHHDLAQKKLESLQMNLEHLRSTLKENSDEGDARRFQEIFNNFLNHDI